MRCERHGASIGRRDARALELPFARSLTFISADRRLSHALMPTYEFRCPSGHSFERFYRKMADAVTELECPVCGKVATRQLSGGAGLVFKGSGFYLTDYGRNAHRNDGGGATASSEKSGSSESKSEGSSSESKTESKAESKAEASKPAPASGGEAKGGDKGGSKSDSSTSSKPSRPKD